MKEIFTIALALQGIGIFALYLFSKNSFAEELALADIKANRLKILLPIGLQVFKLLKHTYGSPYEKKLEVKYRNLKGSKNAQVLLKIHMAQKTVLMLFALFFLTFVGTQIEADATYLFFCAALEAALFYATDKQLDDLFKERSRSIQYEFPELLNKLVLLINAGLSLSGAFQKIVRDNKVQSPLYEELAAAIHEMNSGKSHIQAYESFAKRCRQQEITTFVTILIQNIKRGNDEIIPILKMLSLSSWENRKLVARKLGEEAATRLVLPMMIMFLAILIMVMAPAFFQLNF